MAGGKEKKECEKAKLNGVVEKYIQRKINNAIDEIIITETHLFDFVEPGANILIVNKDIYLWVYAKISTKKLMAWIGGVSSIAILVARTIYWFITK